MLLLNFSTASFEGILSNKIQLAIDQMEQRKDFAD